MLHRSRTNLNTSGGIMIDFRARSLGTFENLGKFDSIGKLKLKKILRDRQVFSKIKLRL